MSRINKLTPEQQADFNDRIEQWRKIGLSTEPLDFATAKPIVYKLYEICGYPKPAMVFHCQSPFQAGIEAAILSSIGDNLVGNIQGNLRGNLEDNLGDNLWDNLRGTLGSTLGANLGDNLRDNLWDNLQGNLWDNLRGTLGSTLWDNLRGNLLDNLRGTLEDNLRGNLRGNLEDNLQDNLWDNLWGTLGSTLWDNLRGNLLDNLWDNLRANLPKYDYQLIGNMSYWFLLAEFCTETLGCSGFDKSLIYCHLAKTGGWILPTSGCAFLQDRPLEMHWEGARLHNASGPAVLYRDGWSMYMWHRRRVDRSVIMDPVTVERINKETNIEIRRILIERYGQAKYVQDSGSTLVHSDDFGTLYRKDELDDEAIYAVKVICPTTGREYILGVDPSAYGGLAGKNARAAVASTWRLENGQPAFTSPSDYAPIVET